MSAASPGRPRAFDTEQILDAALELFWVKGYRGTTSRVLEARLGLNQSSIYNTFGSKQELLDAALNRYEARITRDLVGPLEGSSKGLESVREFFASFGHWITHEGRRGCMLVNMVAETGGEAPEISERARNYRARLRRALRDALVRAAEFGETSEGEAEWRADLLIGLVLGLNVAARGGARLRELRNLVRSAQAQIQAWRG